MLGLCIGSLSSAVDLFVGMIARGIQGEIILLVNGGPSGFNSEIFDLHFLCNSFKTINLYLT